MWITVIKWLLLAAINLCLILLLSKHDIERTRKLRLSNTSQRSQSASRNRTFVLLACVTMYFVTQAPTAAFNFLQIISEPPYCAYYFSYAQKSYFRPVVYSLFLCNYSLNFLLYCMLWRKFRTQVRKLLRGKQKQQKNSIKMRVRCTVYRSHCNRPTEAIHTFSAELIFFVQRAKIILAS